MKVKCINSGKYKNLTEGKIYDAEEYETVYFITDDYGVGGSHFYTTRFEKVKTPYEYLVEYYGLEEGKKYESDNGCEMHVNNIHYYSSLTVKEMLLGDFVFKEIKPIITVEYSTTAEQHAKIKEMLGES